MNFRLNTGTNGRINLFLYNSSHRIETFLTKSSAKTIFRSLSFPTVPSTGKQEGPSSLLMVLTRSVSTLLGPTSISTLHSFDIDSTKSTKFTREMAWFEKYSLRTVESVSCFPSMQEYRPIRDGLNGWGKFLFSLILRDASRINGE